jgi:hypothetical protein
MVQVSLGCAAARIQRFAGVLAEELSSLLHAAALARYFSGRAAHVLRRRREEDRTEQHRHRHGNPSLSVFSLFISSLSFLIRLTLHVGLMSKVNRQF